MECPGDETVFLYLQGSLSGTPRARVRAHVDRCAACREVVAGVASSLDETPASRPDGGERPLDVDATVGRYEVLARIGSGNCGVVYRARDPELGREVALKVLRDDAQVDIQSARRRLMREAKAMARLSHPNVVTVYEAGVAHGHVFLAMELVQGDNLQDWLDARPRSVAEVIDTFADAGRGLAAAHDAGLVHRDFKPENVLVGRDGRVRVTDFGLAQPVFGEPVEALSTGSLAGAVASRFASMTVTGSLGGTPAYMAPEIFRGRAADARSDQYSFCVALFRGVYGQAPTRGVSVEAHVRAVTRGELEWPADRRVPKPIEALLRRGLAVDAQDRFDSMAELVEGLEAQRHAPASPARRPWRALGVIALLGAAAAAFALGESRLRGGGDAVDARAVSGVGVQMRVLEGIAAPAGAATPAPADAAATTSPPSTAPMPPPAARDAPATARGSKGTPRPVPSAPPAAPVAAPRDRDALLPDPWGAR